MVGWIVASPGDLILGAPVVLMISCAIKYIMKSQCLFSLFEASKHSFLFSPVSYRIAEQSPRLAAFDESLPPSS